MQFSTVTTCVTVPSRLHSYSMAHTQRCDLNLQVAAALDRSRFFLVHVPFFRFCVQNFLFLYSIWLERMGIRKSRCSWQKLGLELGLLSVVLVIWAISRRKYFVCLLLAGVTFATRDHISNLSIFVFIFTDC